MPKMGEPASEPKTVQPKAEKPVNNPATDDWFTSLSDTKEYVKAVFYGREGTGKTTAAATASQTGRVLFVNSEGGLKKAALTQHGVNTDNVAVWPPAGETITAKSFYQIMKTNEYKLSWND